MRMVEHASMSSQAMLEQLSRSKMRAGARTFEAHLRRRASSNGRRNCRTSRGGTASSSRVFDRRSTTRRGAQGAHGLEHLAAHLAGLSIWRRSRNVSRDEKLHFSTSSTMGEEKCGGADLEILRTFEPCRELSTEFFAATSVRVFLSPGSKVQSPESGRAVSFQQSARKDETGSRKTDGRRCRMEDRGEEAPSPPAPLPQGARGAEEARRRESDSCQADDLSSEQQSRRGRRDEDGRREDDGGGRWKEEKRERKEKEFRVPSPESWVSNPQFAIRNPRCLKPDCPKSGARPSRSRRMQVWLLGRL